MSAGSYNRVLVGGALTREPRLRFLANGTAEADFGLLLEVDAAPSIPLDIRCRGLLAERVVHGLDRGERAVVSGRLAPTATDLMVIAQEVLALERA